MALVRQIDDKDLTWGITTAGMAKTKSVLVEVYDPRTQTTGTAKGRSELLTKHKALAQLNMKNLGIGGAI